jgi:hypothetical protein
MFMNDELGGTFKETVSPCFKIVPATSRVGAEENQVQNNRSPCQVPNRELLNTV